MRTPVRNLAAAAVCCAQIGLFQSECNASTNFQVVAVTQTVEKSVTLRWNSETNALYRIDYAPSLSTSTAWQALYNNYPSQGTNTFWTDGGNWVAVPPVDHPSNVLQRFYRIAKTGTNISPPQVTVISPTNGAVVSGDVTVSITATGLSSIASMTLFVDGEEFDSIDGDETNLVINTCEWANGPHTLFAVAVDTTGVETTPSTNSVSERYAASPYVTTVFSNYVSRFWFSQPFFEPDLGQTQNISAVFTTNANWTLTILDSSSNVVRTVTGTGASMNFAWDGTDGSSNALPAGLYDFAVSATSTGFSPLSDDPSSSTSRRRAHRVRGKVGTIGVGYQGDHPKGPIGTYHRPTNGLGGYVSLTSSSLPFGPISTANGIASSFAKAMSKGGWKTTLSYGDDNLLSSYLRMPSKGGSSAFNQVNLAFVLNHGVRGTSSDYTISADGPLETYLPIYKTGATDYDWVRLSECDFGGSNLRWITFASCELLNDANYQSMYNDLVLPIDDNLHLLLGSQTLMWAHPQLGTIWARSMLGGFFTSAQTIEQAWFFAGQKTQPFSSPTTTVIFRVTGWPACFSDQLLNYSTPDSGDPANITYDDQQVYP
jgi:hypothetical protein